MSGYEDPQKPTTGYQHQAYEQTAVPPPQQQGYQQPPQDGGYQQGGYQQGGGYPPPPPQQGGGYQQGGYQQGGYPPPQQQAVYAPAPYQSSPKQVGGYPPTGQAPPMQPQQQLYAAQPQSPGGYQDPASGYQQFQAPLLVGVPMYPDCPNETLKTKFISQGYKDVWAAVAFAVQILAMIIWAFVNVGKNSQDFKDNTSTGGNGGLAKKMGSFLTGAAFTSVGMVAIMLAIMRVAPRAYILVANALVVVVNVAAAIYLFTQVGAAGLTFLFLAALHLLWLFLVRRRIPLAGALLANSINVVTRHFGTIVTSFCSLLVMGLYALFYLLMVIPTFVDISNNNQANAANGNGDGSFTFGDFLLFCLWLLMFYWSTQVIINVVHVTASGTVATWYFAGPASMPSNPSVSSLKRAMTTSFGSICFGSLIVALLKLLHALVRSAAHRRASFVAIIALCFVSCLERLMQYFNVYAFTFVAIYGSSFIDAAKQTWEMIKNCGISAIINDNLVYPVLNLTTFIDSLAIGVGFGYASGYWAIGIVSFLISAVIHIIVFRVVYSGIVTLFVCYAENPQVLITSNPQFNQEMLDGIEALKQPICG